MVLLQALFALIRRSLGSVLKAIFGWATLALFGEVREDERALLTATVGAAAIWPFLVVGTAFPRQAAVFLTIVPVPKGTPEEIVRAVWIALTALVPLGVGWALSRRDSAAGSDRWKRILAGFPATLGLGAAFLLACVAVPIRKLSAMARGRKDDHVPLAIPAEDYAATVLRMREALEDAGVPVLPQRPPWATRALGRILHVFAGAVLGAYLPEKLEFLHSPELELTFYPNGVRVFGAEKTTARAHALIAEVATASPALQCMSPEGQEIEKRIKNLWGRRQGESIDRAIRAEARRLAEASLDYDDWQILFRELLQVVVAARGASSLIRRAVEKRSDAAREEPSRQCGPGRRLRRTVREARSYGRSRLQAPAAKRSLDVFQSLVGGVLGLLARRRR
jgi:hypothetical protein